MLVKKRTKFFGLRVQPELLEQAQAVLDAQNKENPHNGKKTTLSDLFEDLMYNLVQNSKK